jgi:hypothetical protein
MNRHPTRTGSSSSKLVIAPETVSVCDDDRSTVVWLKEAPIDSPAETFVHERRRFGRVRSDSPLKCEKVRKIGQVNFHWLGPSGR